MREKDRPKIQEELQTFEDEVDAALHGSDEVFSDVVDFGRDEPFLGFWYTRAKILKLRYNCLPGGPLEAGEG